MAVGSEPGFRIAAEAIRIGPERASYLNVVRADGPGTDPGGNATDFPIFCDLPDEQILEAFVQLVCAITGCQPKQVD